MANKFTLISAVSSGKKDLKLIVRVAHIWCSYDKFNPNEVTFMNMLLVDKTGGKIHASVRKSLVSTIKDQVEEGLTYHLEHVMVGFNEGPFKLTPHKYKLNMMGTTKFTKVNATKVPMNVFDFMAFKDILSSSEEDKITVVIGHVVEKDNIRENDKNGRKTKVIDIKLEDFEVTSRDGLKMLITDEDGENTNATSNVVYHEVFRNV